MNNLINEIKSCINVSKTGVGILDRKNEVERKQVMVMVVILQKTRPIFHFSPLTNLLIVASFNYFKKVVWFKIELNISSGLKSV